MAKTFYVNSAKTRRQAYEYIRAIEGPYRLEVTEIGGRTLEQNAYLWGVCYPFVLNFALVDGKSLKELGWQKEDLHEYFLGEHFGWQVLDGMGRKKAKPMKRSSTLSKSDFSEYVDYIQQTCAERFGLAIGDPGSAEWHD